MNPVGKLFIGLIAVMSIIFMSFTFLVYTSSNDWKKKADEQKSLLDKARTESNQLKQRYEELEKNRDEQLKAKGDIIADLHSQVTVFAHSDQEKTQQLAKLQDAINTATQTIKSTHITLADAQSQQEELRKVFRKTQQDWNELLTEYVAKTDEAHTLSMQLDNLETVSRELVKQYDDAKSVLNRFNLKPDPQMYAGVPPFLVMGRITEVRATGLVEITVGEDSGLMKGHQLDVYRKAEDGRDMYLGVVEVVLTEPNRAACKVLPEYRKGTVQTHDIVTSEFSQERQKYQLKRDAHVATNTN